MTGSVREVKSRHSRRSSYQIRLWRTSKDGRCRCASSLGIDESRATAKGGLHVGSHLQRKVANEMLISRGSQAEVRVLSEMSFLCEASV